MVVSLDSSVGLHSSSDTTAAYLIPHSREKWGVHTQTTEAMTPVLQVHTHTHTFICGRMQTRIKLSAT